MIKVTLLRYHFKFCWNDFSGQYWEYPVVIETVDSRHSDADAYKRAMESFAGSLIFGVNFITSERLMVKMRKEIIKEVSLGDPEETSLPSN